MTHDIDFGRFRDGTRIDISERAEQMIERLRP
jgi:hypothetical protein